VRIEDLVYFAPGLRFSEVDLEGPGLAEQLERRIAGYYLYPAEECCERGHGFAAGVLLVTCIDAVARLRFGGAVGPRFRKFVREELSCFPAGELAGRFYEDFRNGLVHEARIKRGGQFSLERERTVEETDGLLLVNPKYLAREVRDAVARYVKLLSEDEAERSKLVVRLKRDFAKDFSGVSL